MSGTVPNADLPESRALEAAQAINDQAVQLWWNAHYDGVRAGLEAAAVVAEKAAKQVGDDYSIDVTVRAVSIHCLNEMRDALRLTALQPQPESPGVIV